MCPERKKSPAPIPLLAPVSSAADAAACKNPVRDPAHVEVLRSMSVPAVAMHPVLWGTSVAGSVLNLNLNLTPHTCRTSNFFLGGNFSRDVALLWFTSFMFCAPWSPGY